MPIVTLFLLAVSLSMDTLAVSVATGICKQDICLGHAIKGGVIFAFFQMLMPLAGWYAGVRLSSLIEPFDHWLAFVLLLAIGLKMIYEAVHEQSVGVSSDDCERVVSCPKDDPTGMRRLVLLGMATSVDALAAGVSLAIDGSPILIALLMIGSITCTMAMAGMMLGRRLGVLFQRRASVLAGCVLILIGGKIVLEHLTAA